MKSIFQKITEFRKNRKVTKDAEIEATLGEAEYEIDESVMVEFGVSSMQKTKVLSTMSNTMVTNRKNDDLMSQMEETFSQRLLRMIEVFFYSLKR